MVSKKCTKCKQDLALDCYAQRSDGTGKIYGVCKDCQKETRAKHRLNDSYRKKRREYLRTKRQDTKSWFLNKGYKLTYDSYYSMLAAQNNACAICGKTPNDNGRQLSVDHCHETMEVRGLLCVKCNAGIGMFCDNPMLLEQAIKYLRSHLDRSTVSRQAIEV